jgi:benzodiazapine receptor
MTDNSESDAISRDQPECESRSASPAVGIQILGLVVSIAICFAAAGLGAAVTTPQIRGWYTTINKPSWNPPDWIFGPVWSTLYLMMAVSAWLVWRRRGLRAVRGPITMFAVQLVLNSLWSVLFFGMQWPGLAAIEIVILWSAILATAIGFWRQSKVAGGLLIPYLLWVSFATVLNVTIWELNS